VAAFRNSKLTKLLMESFSERAYTLLVAAVSPAQRHFDETANTLSLAAKCGNIAWQVGPQTSPHERELRELRETIESLRKELTGKNVGGNLCCVERERECEFLRQELETAEATAAEAEAATSSLQIEISNIRAEKAVADDQVAASEAKARQAQDKCETLREELAAEREANNKLRAELACYHSFALQQNVASKSPVFGDETSSPSGAVVGRRSWQNRNKFVRQGFEQSHHVGALRDSCENYDGSQRGADAAAGGFSSGDETGCIDIADDSPVHSVLPINSSPSAPLATTGELVHDTELCWLTHDEPAQ